jgi:pimeloyl-ACP methyl ester carboxylesterase
MPYAGQIHYRVSADRDRVKDPLVLIHGAGGSSLHWPPEIRRLPGVSSLAIDLPGHGESTGEEKGNIESYSDAVLHFLDQLEINQVFLAGHSMGSAIAMRMSLDHADRVRGLILVGAGAKLRVHPQLLEDCRREETYPKVVSRLLAWSFSPATDQNLVGSAGKRMQEFPPSVLLADFNACDAFDVREQVAEISQPTLIICGEDDQMTPVRFSQYLAEKIVGSRLEVIPSAGHMVMLEKPRTVADLIVKFVGGLYAAGR